MTKTFIDAPAVAKLLEYPNTPAFLRQRARLEENEDLPQPVRLYTSRMLWRHDEILAWKARLGTDTPPPERPAGTNVVLFNEARTA